MKRFIAIATISSLSVSQLPPAQANPAAVVGAAGCAASVVCGVIVGTVAVAGITYYLVRPDGKRGRIRIPADEFQIHPQPIPQPGPRPGEMRTDHGNYNIPGEQEVHWVANRAACKKMFESLKNEGFTEWDFDSAGMPGARKGGHCKLRGPGARDDRFVDRRYDNGR